MINIYTKLQLKYDNRFTLDDKLSIYMTHYDMFESVESSCIDMQIIIVAGIIIDLFYSGKKHKV